MLKKLTVSAAALMVAAAPALAVPVTATTDLNLRAGPGPEYEVIGVIEGMTQAEVEGCLEDANWCKVSYNGMEGWAYGTYLSASAEQAVRLESPRTVTYTRTVTTTSGGDEGASAATGAVTGGAVLGSLIGGPAAIATGVVLGANAGAEAAEPESTTVTYITQHPVDPVYLDGEVVLGAGVPETVELYPVPETEYSYVNVNGQTVLVEPQDRSIVYIYR